MVGAGIKEESTKHSPKVPRSSVVSHDRPICLFYKTRAYKKERSMQNVPKSEAANTIRECAEAKGDQDMLRVLLGVNNDLSEARYHKTCFASYVSRSYLKSRAFKEEPGKEPGYDKAFLEMATGIGKGLESGKAYCMSSLLKKYADFLERKGIDGQNYTKQKLKFRVKLHFGDAVVFQQCYRENSPELVYSSCISLKDVINASTIWNNEQLLPSQAENQNHSTQDPSATLLLYGAAKLLKYQTRQYKGLSIYPANVSDIDLTTAKNIVPRDQYLFLRWVVTNDEVEVDFESSCSNEADEREVLCLAQDTIHCALSRIGKKKAWKSIIKNKVHQESLARVGQSPDVNAETAKKAEAVITISNGIPASFDEARYLLFCQKSTE